MHALMHLEVTYSEASQSHADFSTSTKRHSNDVFAGGPITACFYPFALKCYERFGKEEKRAASIVES